MKKGKLIVIEGTDCSGKETQSKLLKEKLKEKKISVFEMQFPRYDTPTGKIIGGPYLGKSYISNSYFDEGAVNVPPKVASLYYTADRLYNKDVILEHLNAGEVVILDRYVESNMAHQGAKYSNKKERNEMFEFLEKLEFEFLELPRPDNVIFLHMPYDAAIILKKDRNEELDGHESDANHLKTAEKAYLEMAQKYNFKTVECTKSDGSIKTIEEINMEVFSYTMEVING